MKREKEKREKNEREYERMCKWFYIFGYFFNLCLRA